jgi:hypothetical protein
VTPADVFKRRDGRFIRSWLLVAVASFRPDPNFVFEVVLTLQSLLLRALPLPSAGRVLADSEWCSLARIAEVLIPDSCEVSPDDIADNVEAFLQRGRSRRAWRVRVLLHLVEWAPVTLGRQPLSRLSVSERRRLVEERYVDGHGLWGLCAKVRYLVLMGAYGDRRLHASTSYVPVSKRRRFSQESNGAGAAAS